MSCPFEEDLTAYVDGELPHERRAEVETHLSGCAGCQGTEALLRRTVARMAELPEFTPSTATRREVLAKVDALPRPLGERLRALLRPTVLVPAAGLAAVAGLALYTTAPREPALEVPDAGTLELAMNLEVVEDYEVLGLDESEDLEVVAHLHELEEVQ
jgi:anti-sigma factor RsiW